MDIFASIESNYSFVRIIGDKNYSNVFYQEYRNTYQDFYYNDGILEIKATDKKENEIEIFIEY